MLQQSVPLVLEGLVSPAVKSAAAERDCVLSTSLRGFLRYHPVPPEASVRPNWRTICMRYDTLCGIEGV